MKKTFVNILNFLLFFSITGVVVYLVFKGIDLKYFIEKILSANFFYVFISGISGIIAFYFRGLRWKLMLKPFGYNPKDMNMYHAVAVGYIANMAIPRLGEVVRCASLKKTDKVEVKHSMGTVVTERISDLAVLFLLVVFVFIVKADFFGAFISEQILIPLSKKITISTLGLVIAGLILGGVLFLWWIFKRFSENKLVSKTKTILKGFGEGLISIYKMEDKWLFLLYTLIIWFFYWLMAYIVFFAIEPTKGLTAMDAIFILIAGSFGMVAPVQNGFGAYHWIVSQALMIYGLSREDGLLYATLVHETQVVMVLIFGSISSYIVFFKKNKTYESK